MRRSSRIDALPPYLFAEIDAAKIRARDRGVDVIDLGVGDPDLPTPPAVVESLATAARVTENHRYPSYQGLRDFQSAVARWYERRFGVRLDPATEVLSLIGSKEGIAHLPLALVDPGDVVLVPDPCYPVYVSGTTFAGGIVHAMPLRRERGFLPDLAAIPSDVARRAALVFANYPNNPTGAVAPPEFMRDLAAFGRATNTIVCHDAAYTEMAFDGWCAPSFLQAEGAREVGIEIHSCSKSFCMTGWRIGFAVGNRDVLAALGDVKKNVDSGVFQAVQRAAISALDLPESEMASRHEEFRRRRDALVEGLRAAGWDAVPPRATFYVWAPTPRGLPSVDVARRLLDEAGIVATPGVGFGAAGEGYVRFAVTVSTDRVREAAARLARVRF